MFACLSRKARNVVSRSQGEMSFRKIDGAKNPGDLFTKPLDEATMKGHLDRLQVERRSGRAASAPQRKAMQPQQQSQEEAIAPSLPLPPEGGGGGTGGV